LASKRRPTIAVIAALSLVITILVPLLALAQNAGETPAGAHSAPTTDYWSLIFVLVLSTFIGLGVIVRVSRLLHTPLMSITNAISAIAVIGSILVTITDRMLKMFKQSPSEGKKS
jgi:NAD/NADP transhydrogenase alpha subunit